MIRKVGNYIIELHPCKCEKGIIIEISKKQEIDNVSIVKKQYLFYKTSREVPYVRLKHFIKENILDKDLRNLL